MPLSPENFQQQLSNSFLDTARQRCDREADEVLNTLIAEQGKKEALRLFDLLIQNIELPLTKLPEEIRQFITNHRQLPDWADARQIRLAQELFADHGPKFLLFLFYKSLPILYACKNGAQVLVQTGRLAHQSDSLAVFNRRIAETGQFLINIMDEGSFGAGGKAVESALKVRLIHAAIRQFIPADHWDATSLGQPINQEDLAITLMTFSVALTDALAQFQIEETEERQAAFLHCWNIVGYLMGVEEALLPPDLNSAHLLLQTIQERQSAPSPEGVRLTEALVDFAHKTIPSQELKDAPAVLIPFLIGDERAAMLGVQQNFGCLTAVLPAFLRSLLQWGERLEDKSLPLKIIVDLLSKEMVKKMMAYFNENKKTLFVVPKGWVAGE